MPNSCGALNGTQLEAREPQMSEKLVSWYPRQVKHLVIHLWGLIPSISEQKLTPVRIHRIAQFLKDGGTLAEHMTCQLNKPICDPRCPMYCSNNAILD